MKILLVSYNTLGTGMSGGDRINIEMVRRLLQDGHEVKAIVWKEGADMYRKEGIPSSALLIWPSAGGEISRWLGFMGRILMSLLLPSRPLLHPWDLVWSGSDAVADTLPAWLFTRRARRPWLAACYLFAPLPWFGYRGAEQRRFTRPSLRQAIFYLFQRITLPLIRRRADRILVTGEEDRERFIRLGRDPAEVFVVRGGVDLAAISKIPPSCNKPYDAIFIGRFHVQKGVLELADIWSHVCRQRPGATLAFIGAGHLEHTLKARIKDLGLGKNVFFLGFMDGDEKHRVLKSTRIVVHPAVYDSGGMAPAAALACGLPGVCFDLPSLRTYYQKGFLRAPLGNLEAFAQRILALLEDAALYRRMSLEAIEESKRWDWDARYKSWLEFVCASLSINKKEIIL